MTKCGRTRHDTPEKFENGIFTLKPYQMLSVHNTLKKFENATITGHFVFVFEENSGREILTFSFSKRFPSTLKRKAGVFKFLRFEERFRKAPFS